MKTLMGFVAVLALTAAAAAPASANITNGDGFVSETVRLGDLNLHRDEDAKIALQRIQRAARNVCTGSYDQWGHYLNSSQAFRTCVAQASNRAVAKLDSPIVTALAESWPFQVAMSSPSR